MFPDRWRRAPPCRAAADRHADGGGAGDLAGEAITFRHLLLRRRPHGIGHGEGAVFQAENAEPQRIMLRHAKAWALAAALPRIDWASST